MSNILVTGGSGYIGSHTVVELIEDGHSVVVVDNLSNSNEEAIRRVEKITGKNVPFFKYDLRDASLLDKIFRDFKFDAVIHFAGFKSVGQSVADPLGYYDNNLISTIRLLEKITEFGVNKFVFSSTAGVYGIPEKLPLDESCRTGVGIFSPYGRTKYMIEQILEDLCVANSKLEVTCLRYFNPVGAHKSGLIGEDPGGIPDNILPYVSLVAVGKLEKVNVYGNDYDTPDGTGIRDYIHVVDLARGHLAAINHLKPGFNIYNLGTGKGVSVLELIDAFSKAAGKKIPYVIAPRRPSDVASNYSSPTKANKELGWKAERTILEACKDAWKWQSMNPLGYK